LQRGLDTGVDKSPADLPVGQISRAVRRSFESIACSTIKNPHPRTVNSTKSLLAATYHKWYNSDMKKAAKKKAGTIGSSFDSFLKQDGTYEEVTARAIKRVLARQLDDLMKREEISKTELASRMRTSRAQLDRLLDPENESVTLATLARAARAVGRNLRMELV
jgi:DNA-binding Xre family transcriptional regulator